MTFLFRIRGTVVTKASLRVQFLLALGGRGWEEQEALALLIKKGLGREGSIESQQNFDFFVLILCLREALKKTGYFMTSSKIHLLPTHLIMT